jgi:hypothetical protein
VIFGVKIGKKLLFVAQMKRFKDFCCDFIGTGDGSIHPMRSGEGSLGAGEEDTSMIYTKIFSIGVEGTVGEVVVLYGGDEGFLFRPVFNIHPFKCVIDDVFEVRTPEGKIFQGLDLKFIER